MYEYHNAVLSKADESIKKLHLNPIKRYISLGTWFGQCSSQLQLTLIFSHLVWYILCDQTSFSWDLRRKIDYRIQITKSE